MKKIAVINRQSSFNSAHARESLDLVLIFAAYDQAVSVFFIDDGVYQLLTDQQPEHIEGKDYLATMKTFELYDVEQIVVCQQHLQQRGLCQQPLALAAQILTAEQIAALLTTFDHVITV